MRDLLDNKASEIFLPFFLVIKVSTFLRLYCVSISKDLNLYHVPTTIDTYITKILINTIEKNIYCT